MLVAFFYKLLLFLGDLIFSGGFKIGDEVLDQLEVKVKYSACRVDGDFILYEAHE